MACGKYKDLTKRTESDTVLREIASSSLYDGYQRVLASMFYEFFDKKYKVSGIKSMSNQQLSDKLHKPVIKKSKRIKIYSSFKTIFGELI